MYGGTCNKLHERLKKEKCTDSSAAGLFSYEESYEASQNLSALRLLIQQNLASSAHSHIVDFVQRQLTHEEKMEQQAKAPQDLRNVVDFLRSSKAGMKIRVGVLNGKRIDYFKGTCHDHHLSVGLLSAVLGALQYTSRAVRPELLDRTRLIVLFVYL